MADPATQFQAPSIQATGYSPVVGGNLGGSHLFGGSGQILAGIGQTALNAAGQFQNATQQVLQSPVNPMVYAQEQAQRKASQEGVAQQQWVDDQGQLGHMIRSVDAAGNSIVMPAASITDPTLAAQFAYQTGILPRPDADHKPPLYNRTVQPQPNQSTQPGPPTTQQIKTPEQQGGFEGSEYAPGPAQPSQPSQPAKPAPPTTGQMSKTVSADPATDARVPYLSALNTHSAGLMAGTGAGNYALAGVPDPGVERQSAADYRAQYAAQHPSGSIWSPQRPAPLAPPAPGAPPADQPPAQPPAQPADQQPTSGSPAAATKADQASMQQWQNQNAHPVMSSQQALAWMKTQTTLAQDATYLPMGGPNGTPAFGFHMKGGGMNVMPVAQMIQKGAGPMVAAENTSAIMSKSDQAQQGGDQGYGQSAAAVGAAPPQPQMQPTGQVSGAPTGTPAQPWGPPPAPGPGAQGQPPAAQTPTPTQYPNVSGPPPAPLPGAYDPTAYRQAIAQAMANPRNLMAQNAPAGNPAQIPQQPAQPPPRAEDISPTDAAAIQAKADAMGETDPNAPYKGDRIVEGTSGPYTYYRDDNPNSKSRGRIYTTLPGKAGHYYEQQKWYPGTNTYESYELPDTAARQIMWDKWGATGYLPRESRKNPDGTITKGIDQMSEEEMEPWLQRAWQIDHLQNAPIDSGTNLTLDAFEQSHKNIAQIRDMLQTLAENGYSDLGVADRISAASENAGRSLTTTRKGAIYDAGRFLGGVMKGAAGDMTPDAAALIRALDEKIQEEQALMDSHPGMLLNPGKGGGQDTPNIHGSAINAEIANIPNTTLLQDTAFSGQDIKEKLKRFNAWGEAMDTRYNSVVDGQHVMMYRVDPKHEVNSLRAVQGREIDDPSNIYKNHKFPSSMTPQEAIDRTNSSTADPFPTITAQQLPDWKNNHPGAYYFDEGHNLRRVKPILAPTPTPIPLRPGFRS